MLEGEIGPYPHKSVTRGTDDANDQFSQSKEGESNDRRVNVMSTDEKKKLLYGVGEKKPRKKLGA